MLRGGSLTFWVYIRLFHYKTSKHARYIGKTNGRWTSVRSCSYIASDSQPQIFGDHTQRTNMPRLEYEDPPPIILVKKNVSPGRRVWIKRWTLCSLGGGGQLCFPCRIQFGWLGEHISGGTWFFGCETRQQRESPMGLAGKYGDISESRLQGMCIYIRGRYCNNLKDWSTSGIIRMHPGLETDAED